MSRYHSSDFNEMPDFVPEVGALVWAHIEGWPWWPAVVVNRSVAEGRVAEDLVAKFPPDTEHNATVMFFNWDDTFDVMELSQMEDFIRSISKVQCGGPHQPEVIAAAEEAVNWLRIRGNKEQLEKATNPRFVSICKRVGIYFNDDEDEVQIEEGNHRNYDHQDHEQVEYVGKIERTPPRRKNNSVFYQRRHQLPPTTPTMQEEETALEALLDVDDMAPPVPNENYERPLPNVLTPSISRKRGPVVRFSSHVIRKPESRPLRREAPPKLSKPAKKRTTRKPIEFSSSDEEGDCDDTEDWTPEKEVKAGNSSRKQSHPTSPLPWISQQQRKQAKVKPAIAKQSHPRTPYVLSPRVKNDDIQPRTPQRNGNSNVNWRNQRIAASLGPRKPAPPPSTSPRGPSRANPAKKHIVERAPGRDIYKNNRREEKTGAALGPRKPAARDSRMGSASRRTPPEQPSANFNDKRNGNGDSNSNSCKRCRDIELEMGEMRRELKRAKGMADRTRKLALELMQTNESLVEKLDSLEKGVAAVQRCSRD